MARAALDMAKFTIKQHDSSDCGAACLASICSYYQLEIPISRIRQFAGTGKNGTNIMGLIEAAGKLGFDSKGVRGDSSSLSKIPKPAIAHVRLSEKAHHYVVIYQVNKSVVKLMDPGQGKMLKKDISLFLKEWTGVLVILLPSDSFRVGNERISSWLRFWHLLRPHRYMMIQALVASLFYTLLGFSTSLYIQKVTDHVWVNGDGKLLNLLSLSVLLILIIRFLLSLFKDVFILRAGQEIDGRLVLGYYRHLLKLPQRFFDTMRVGEIISRVNDAVKIRIFISNTAISLLVNVLIIIFSFLLMFSYSWKLGLMMLFAIPVYLTVYLISDQLNKKTERRLMECAADLESQLVASLSTIRTIKQFGLEEFSRIHTETRFVKLLKTGYLSSLNHVFSTNTTQVVSSLYTIVLLWVGSALVIRQEITPGEILSAYAIIGYFSGPVASLVSSNKTVQNALIAAERLFELIDLEIEEPEEEQTYPLTMAGDIRFKNVSFRYGSGLHVLKNFNLRIPRGALTAIVGESGSGKSTLANILIKLYPVQEGGVFVADQDLKYMSARSVRAKMAIVPQKIDMFPGSIMDNIVLDQLGPDMEKVLAICRSLCLLPFIEALPQGFMTQVGEQGAVLSGGQKQRVALARALYRDPEILILDEATASLDSHSERCVLQTLSEFRNTGKTIILISHRLSSLVFADQIIVVDQGAVVETGKHSELLSRKEHYYSLWKQHRTHSSSVPVENAALYNSDNP